MVEHVKHGRQHTHIVWSRIDVVTAKAIPDSHNYRRHEIVSRELEQEFGHERVLGAHIRDKENQERPERGPTWGEHRQAERSGMTPAEAKTIVTYIWQHTTTGHDFRHRLEVEGFMLARGDRRDFVLIDQAGELHGLTRRVEGATAASIRERLADIDRDSLPDVANGRRRLLERQQAAEPWISAVERLRREELQREAEARAEGAKLNHNDQDIADAIFQLNRTMRSQIEVTLPGTVRPKPQPRESLYEQAERTRQQDKARIAADELRRQHERPKRKNDFEPER